MRQSFKAILAAGFLLTTTSQALAQATTTRENDTPPTAEKAEQMKNQSSQAANPTEQNPTYRNQAKEQPGDHTPSAPATMAPTGQTSDNVPPQSKQTHHFSGKHKAHHKKTAAPQPE